MTIRGIAKTMQDHGFGDLLSQGAGAAGLHNVLEQILAKR